MKKAANQKVRLRHGLLLAGLFLALLLCIPLLWQIYRRVPGKIDFFLHHAEYENIVHIVKTQGITQGESGKSQRIDSYRVWVKRSEAGQYTITIQTVDRGHLGYGGYVYADTPPARLQNPSYRNFDAPGDLPFVDQRINSYWWTVYNNLY